MPEFTASYTSPTNPAFSISQPLPAVPSSGTGTGAAAAAAAADKVAYLAALRQAVSTLQDGINEELTARMAEDVAKVAAAGVSAAAAAVDDVAEEEHYGEEVQEDDD